MNNSTPAVRRLIKDLQKIRNEGDDGINATPDENNIYKWEAYIEGPAGTPWQDGIF